jgi:hypothetical protein
VSSILTVACSGDKFSKTESVHMYQADNVASLGLNEDALILVALLAGGDYLVCPISMFSPLCSNLYVLIAWPAWI